MNYLDKIISEAVDSSIKKVLKEYFNLKVSNVFFKICELADSKNFTYKDWYELSNMCKRKGDSQLNEGLNVKVLFVFRKACKYAKESYFDKNDWYDLAEMCINNHH